MRVFDNPAVLESIVNNFTVFDIAEFHREYGYVFHVEDGKLVGFSEEQYR